MPLQARSERVAWVQLTDEKLLTGGDLAAATLRHGGRQGGFLQNPTKQVLFVLARGLP